MKTKNKRVIIGICGSIAAYKICGLVHKLRYRGIEVKCILTRSAQHFVTPLTLQTLSDNPVYTEMFDLESRERIPEHVALAGWADLIVIAPATATTIAKLANGIADELLVSVVMASRAPLLVCPAMNNNMWNHPANRENTKKLKSFGCQFAGPESGMLACGEKGPGRLASIDVIFNKIISTLSR